MATWPVITAVGAVFATVAAAYYLFSRPVVAKAQRCVPLWLMLPLDTHLRARTLSSSLATTAAACAVAGVHGVIIDVWWGVAEPAPGAYDFAGYKRVVATFLAAGLRVTCIMSFHACGMNVGDDVTVELPVWAQSAAVTLDSREPVATASGRQRQSHSLSAGSWASEAGGDGGACSPFYVDSSGAVNREYLSLWADHQPCLPCAPHGRETAETTAAVAASQRTPLQAYTDFMVAFRNAFAEELTVR
jgi:beta-amylase